MEGGPSSVNPIEYPQGMSQPNQRATRTTTAHAPIINRSTAVKESSSVQMKQKASFAAGSK
jgi:hypothetical protein